MVFLNNHNSISRELPGISGRMAITGGNKKFCQYEIMSKLTINQKP